MSDVRRPAADVGQGILIAAVLGLILWTLIIGAILLALRWFG